MSTTTTTGTMPVSTTTTLHEPTVGVPPSVAGIRPTTGLTELSDPTTTLDPTNSLEEETMSVTEVAELHRTEREVVINRALLNPGGVLIRRPGQDVPGAVAVMPEGQSQVECRGCYGETLRLVSDRVSLFRPLMCAKCRRTEEHRDVVVFEDDLRHYLGVIARLGVTSIDTSDETKMGSVRLWALPDGDVAGTLLLHPRLLPSGARNVLRAVIDNLTDPLNWAARKWHESKDGDYLTLCWEWRLEDKHRMHLYTGPDDI